MELDSFNQFLATSLSAVLPNFVLVVLIVGRVRYLVTGEVCSTNYLVLSIECKL